MKILYGVQGTGNGHITRARIMAKAFNKRANVQVDFVFSGREHNQYFDMQVFGNFRSFQGLTFKTTNGAINRWQTVKSLKLRQLIKDINQLDIKSYDLVVNDFEPITAWAAKKNKIPSISLSHQAAFMHAIPTMEADLLDKLITRYFAPCDIQLGVHWYHFGFPIIPPFVEQEIVRVKSDTSILVYLPFEEADKIQLILATFAEYDFICFHPSAAHTHTKSNIVWHPISKTQFRAALVKSRGVIANAGFELASECLHLNKSLLLKPLGNQFEQISNAHTLAELGLCTYMRTLDLDIIELWLATDFQKTIYFPANPDILIDWLLKKQWSNTEAICKELWHQVKFPPSILEQLSRLPS